MAKSRSSFAKPFVVFSCLLLLVQSPITRSGLPSGITSLVGYYDEFLGFVFFGVLLVRVMLRGIPKNYFKIVLLFVAFIAVGFIGTAANNLQPASAVIEDVVACSKFLIVLYGSISLMKDKDSAAILLSLEKISRVLIVVLFSLVVVDELLPGMLFSSGTGAFGLREVHLFYYHPSVLAQVSALLLAVVSIGFPERNRVYRVLALLVMCSTLTSKAIGFVFLYFFLCGIGRTKSGVARFGLVCCAVLCVLFVSYDAISLYYGNAQSARYTLMADSLKIAANNAPVGLGFGTFGSAAAANAYSPVYLQLGYLAHYGLGYAGTTSYLTDTFWPVLFGEFGYLGTLLYSGLIFVISRKCVYLLNRNRGLGIASLSIMGYLLICSTGATAFFNPMSVANALVLGLCLASKKRPEADTVETGETVPSRTSLNGYRKRRVN